MTWGQFLVTQATIVRVIVAVVLSGVAAGLVYAGFEIWRG